MMIMKMLYRLRSVILVATLMLVSGCAEYPSSGSGSGSGAMLNITMSVSGTINPNYFYFVTFNNINDPHGVTGPIPVIAPPWGNGFVAGAATSYVEYSSALPGDGYLLYNFTNSTLQSSSAVGAPSQDTAVQSGGNTIQLRQVL